MSELHKCINNDNRNFESKEGEQRRLCSNNVINCSPSLVLSTNQNSEEQQNENFILTPKSIEIFTAFAVTLKKIHVRLMMEGYIIKDGEIYKPGEIDNYETSNKINNSNT